MHILHSSFCCVFGNRQSCNKVYYYCFKIYIQCNEWQCMAWQALQCLNAFRLRPCQASLINLVGMIKSNHPKNCFREQFEEVSPTDKKRPTTPAPTHENLEDQRLKKSFKLKNLGRYIRFLVYFPNLITLFLLF